MSEVRNRRQESVPTSTQATKAARHHHRTKSSRRLLNIAPLNTPLKNRLQTVGVIWHTISIPFFVCLFLITLSFGLPAWIGLILPYYIWWYGFDLHTPTNGKVVYRTRNWMRNLIIWKWFVDYFPIRVYKTYDLEPTFSYVNVEDELPDDEEDLVSEYSRTIMDKVFKLLGLRKRLNDNDPPSSSSSANSSKLKKITSGPRYIFGYHPHGVISMGAMGTFATNALRNEPFQPPFKFLKFLFHDPSKYKQLLPGIGNIFPLTITTQFTLPFYRDYLLSLGLTSASAKNIKSLINNGDNSVCIVVGGAQESLLNTMVGDHHTVGHGFKNEKEEEEKEEEEEEEKEKEENPKTEKRQIKLVLNKRKGFVKLAIELGNVSLVPIFAFGEVDIYKITSPKQGSLGYMFQRWMKSTFAFTVPFFSARGIFIYDFGFLPYRNGINVVMGKPIHIPSGTLAKYLQEHDHEEEDHFKPNKVPQELLNHYHKCYVDELKRVYEENKTRFGYENVELCIIE